jgi:hypothetical protein
MYKSHPLQMLKSGGSYSDDKIDRIGVGPLRDPNNLTRGKITRGVRSEQGK